MAKELGYKVYYKEEELVDTISYQLSLNKILEYEDGIDSYCLPKYNLQWNSGIDNVVRKSKSFIKLYDLYKNDTISDNLDMFVELFERCQSFINELN